MPGARPARRRTPGSGPRARRDAPSASAAAPPATTRSSPARGGACRRPTVSSPPPGSPRRRARRARLPSPRSRASGRWPGVSVNTTARPPSMYVSALFERHRSLFSTGPALEREARRRSRRRGRPSHRVGPARADDRAGAGRLARASRRRRSTYSGDREASEVELARHRRERHRRRPRPRAHAPARSSG